MDYPCMSRQFCGHDLRMVRWTPADIARADALVLEHGGVISNYIGSDGAGLGVEWLGMDGRHFLVESWDMATALSNLSAMLRDCDGKVTSPATLSPLLS